MFTIPNVPYGRYAIFILNENGTSNVIGFNVIDPDKETPVIESVFPTSAEVGDVVTVRGSGFTPTRNTIYAGNMTFTNVPSPDGVTLTFVVESLITPEDLEIAPDSETEELIKNNYTGEIPEAGFEPLWVYIENEGGFSNDGFFWRKFEDIDEIMEMMQR